MDTKLADKLLFSKEAANYLGITTQRLNVLVKEGKIAPLKKNSSGTIFHIEELDKRKSELDIFKKIDQGATGMFQFDTNTKIEALNFASLMNALEITEQKLDPLFSRFSANVDTTIFLNDPMVLPKYVEFFQIPESRLTQEFQKAKRAFLGLMEDDQIIQRGQSNYPVMLAQTEQAPRFLYLRGNVSLLQEKRTVALVGSRQASIRAASNTKKLAKILGKNGITIISGLAKGIDVAAHTAALENGFNTISVIGTNLNQYYPRENQSVQKEIEKKGLVVSQFSPANKTERWFFPLRNGVMSGLSLATVIMEAGETSGALKQADYALKQNREVLIPHSALEMEEIQWPKKYVLRGAKVFSTSQDVLQLLAYSNIYRDITDENRDQSDMEDEDSTNYWIELNENED